MEGSDSFSQMNWSFRLYQLQQEQCHQYLHYNHLPQEQQQQQNNHVLHHHHQDHHQHIQLYPTYRDEIDSSLQSSVFTRIASGADFVESVFVRNGNFSSCSNANGSAFDWSLHHNTNATIPCNHPPAFNRVYFDINNSYMPTSEPRFGGTMRNCLYGCSRNTKIAEELTPCLHCGNEDNSFKSIHSIKSSLVGYTVQGEQNYNGSFHLKLEHSSAECVKRDNKLMKYEQIRKVDHSKRSRRARKDRKILKIIKNLYHSKSNLFSVIFKLFFVTLVIVSMWTSKSSVNHMETTLREVTFVSVSCQSQLHRDLCNSNTDGIVSLPSSHQMHGAIDSVSPSNVLLLSRFMRAAKEPNTVLKPPENPVAKKRKMRGMQGKGNKKKGKRKKKGGM